MVNVYSDQDDSLWQKIREGSAAAFNILYEKYWQVVYEGAMKRLKDHDQAQDITQDIFTGLWLKREELQIDNMPAYLHVSVRNRVLNIIEKERRYIPFEQLLYDNINLGERADAIALRNEFLDAYRALIDSLPPQRKKIFRYYYNEGLSTEEIAQRLALSRKTVQNQLGRAVTFLRTGLSHLFLLLILFIINL
jgi:RNA polymerase sigma-70 factor (ECF subfamily)